MLQIKKKEKWLIPVWPQCHINISSTVALWNLQMLVEHRMETCNAKIGKVITHHRTLLSVLVALTRTETITGHFIHRSQGSTDFNFT